VQPAFRWRELGTVPSTITSKPRRCLRAMHVHLYHSGGRGEQHTACCRSSRRSAAASAFQLGNAWQGRGPLSNGSNIIHSGRENVGVAYAIAYLLGLLAMIKCSICSYQCDN